MCNGVLVGHLFLNPVYSSTNHFEKKCFSLYKPEVCICDTQHTFPIMFIVIVYFHM